MATLTDHEIEHVREIQLGLRGVKVCRACGVRKFCGEFRAYGVPDCMACKTKVAEHRAGSDAAADQAREAWWADFKQRMLTPASARA